MSTAFKGTFGNNLPKIIASIKTYLVMSKYSIKLWQNATSEETCFFEKEVISHSSVKRLRAWWLLLWIWICIIEMEKLCNGNTTPTYCQKDKEIQFKTAEEKPFSHNSYRQEGTELPNQYAKLRSGYRTRVHIIKQTGVNRRAETTRPTWLPIYWRYWQQKEEEMVNLKIII